MRIDLALKYLCLSKSRSNVKTLCDKEQLRINGRAAKPSSTLHPGDRVDLEYRDSRFTFDIIEVPGKQLSKTEAREYYRVIHD